MKKHFLPMYFAAAILFTTAPALYAGQSVSDTNTNNPMGAIGDASGQTSLDQLGGVASPGQAAQYQSGTSSFGRQSAQQGDSDTPRQDNTREHADSAGLTSNDRRTDLLYRHQPNALSSFQLLIQRSYGYPLPIYGANLFLDPSTFAALPNAPPTTDYILSTGDQVLVRMWGPVTMNESLTIDRAGDIFLPEVGTIHVAGLSYEALTAQVRAAVSRVFRNFNLSVDLGRLHSIQIFVTGEARRPGTYTVSSLATLVNAVFSSGGPSNAGSLRRIELRRDDHVITTFDFYDLLLRGDKSKDQHLLPGDVIFIPPVGPQVGIAGQVKEPAVYELKGSESLGEQLDLAGGINPVASTSGATLQQIVHHDFRESRTVPFTPEGLATPLSDGDLIIIHGITNRFENTVTIRGNVAEPGRFAWHPGMRLTDIIPEKASLLTPSYWEERNAEGHSNPFLQGLPVQSTGDTDQQDGTIGSLPEGAARGSGEELGGVASSLPASRGGISMASPGTTDTESSLNQGVGARVTVGASRITKVTVPAAEIDWTYAVIERTRRDTLRNELIPFNLGRLVLDHDEKEDLPLEPGDVVTIFSQADFHVAQEQTTKFVRIEGEIASAGVYSVHPGETLQSLVLRAGGMTPQAYLFGAQFTRESTRAVQQQRVDEYIDKLSVDMERSTAQQSLSQSGSSANSTALTLEERMISQLRQQRATGRIVLPFKTSSEGLESIPALDLENGDVLLIPQRPSTVNVIGAVPDQSSFLFKEGGTVKYYLHLAGEPDRQSDPKHAFVIRANGAVLSRDRSGFWGDTFADLKLSPGDTLVIPAKLLKPSALRTFIDSSSAFSSLALVAATVAVAH